MDDPLPSTRGLFGMGVAAELTGVHPQTLRGYESKGLVEPFRTEGGTRRYSHDDLTRIRRITVLLASGLNLYGVQRVLELEAETAALRDEVVRLRAER
jgi:MerR family transcriptional regulator/heat shock protein HspR